MTVAMSLHGECAGEPLRATDEELVADPEQGVHTTLHGAAISTMISLRLNIGSVQGGSYRDSWGVPMTFHDL